MLVSQRLFASCGKRREGNEWGGGVYSWEKEGLVWNICDIRINGTYEVQLCVRSIVYGRSFGTAMAEPVPKAMRIPVQEMRKIHLMLHPLDHGTLSTPASPLRQ